MPATVFRADYDRLNQVATAFGQQAADLRQSLQQLKRQAETLQGGDWLGQGAQAFYAEMNGQILPTMNRLVRALEAAADTTRQVRQIAQQAESEAASFFKLDGAGNGNGASGPGGAGASALTGGAGPDAPASPAPKTGTPLKAPVAPVVKGRLDAKGQQAYDKYLADYKAYLEQQAKAWDWKTVEQKLKGQPQAAKQLINGVVDKVAAPLKELYAKEGRAPDPARREKVLNVIQQERNVLAKAEVERAVLAGRAEALFAEAEKAASQDGFTDAEKRDLNAKWDNQQIVKKVQQDYQYLGEFLTQGDKTVEAMK